MPLSIFLFTNALRLRDNLGLIECCKTGNDIACIFIMTPGQLKDNPYKSDRSIQFMHESLIDLNKAIQNNLSVFYGKPHHVIRSIVTKYRVQNIHINMGYTKYSINRDEKIKKVCMEYNCKLIQHHDILLHPVNTITENSFSDFYKKIKTHYVAGPIPMVKTCKLRNISSRMSKSLKCMSNFYIKKTTKISGGRINGLKILRNKKKWNSYKRFKDKFRYDTTKLSSHLKFGTVSPREVYHVFKHNEAILKQLYRIEFFINIGYNNIGFEEGRKFQGRLVKWDNTYFRHWKNGTTGIPILDAIMRELKDTGYCHNRARLISANFAKLLLIDWKVCEKYYARVLIDYDLIINHFNWLSVYSLGPFSSSWSNIMNPYDQGKIYDKNADYIKKWIPELKNVPVKDIHNWENTHDKYNTYRKPIISFNSQNKKYHRFYKILQE